MTREQLWSLSTDNRPTEWLAVFLMLAGWIPVAPIGEGLDRLMYFAPRWAGKRAPSDDPTLGKTPRELAKVCPECGEEYPPTPAFWHINGDGADGLYSICRICKNKYRRKYYQRRKRRALVNRK